ncbi:MAG TPA: glycosyltransferase family 4 protein [Spirochaetota bacterium]|nr:glycosyltransferase family 4 protein [Spirochaetota bacterium]HPI89829.1 glycosyltransferase family 4 protein [Spirochaetota bacterium]HPR49399.1 glycosyltransferase family 4 protein [Spirochaetota bacterium]
MKVLLHAYRGSPFCGGLGVYLFYLSRELARLGVEVDVVVGPPYPDPLDEWATVHRMENLNIWMVRTRSMNYDTKKRLLSPWNFVDYFLTRFHIFPEMETFSMRTFFFLKELLGKKQFDIIHDVNTLGWGLIPMKGYGIPIVSTIHHPLNRDRDADLTMDTTFWGKLTTLLFYPLGMQRIVSKRIDRVITSSHECLRELNQVFNLPEKKISVVFNGMDVDLFRNTGEKREENALLFVGNTEDHKKGIHFLLEALSLLPEHIKLTIVDEKKLNAATLVKKYHVENRVEFTGKVDNQTLVSLYSRKTILVMSSLYEGFGLPAAEAMACETPVVATAAGALKEVVDDKTGILVPPGDPLALKNAVMQLLGDKKRRDRMGKEGRIRAENNFAWPVAAKNTLDVYRDVIERYRS